MKVFPRKDAKPQRENLLFSAPLRQGHLNGGDESIMKFSLAKTQSRKGKTCSSLRLCVKVI